MTTANKITIVRILLIPVFVTCAVYYGESFTGEDGRGNDFFRWTAIAVFVLASASDGLDGYIARRFNQKTRLGAILDPLADKGLMMAALLTLSLSGWSPSYSPLPLWFPVFVIAKDLLSILGAFVIQHLAGTVSIRPHWTGKVATFTTMVAIGWVMLQVPFDPAIPSAVAGVFVFASGIHYLRDASRQIHESGSATPDSQTQ